MDSSEIVIYLKNIRYIGPFPTGIEVLLVSVSNALDETKVLYPELTRDKLISLLKTEGVYVFNNLEDWCRHKNTHVGI